MTLETLSDALGWWPVLALVLGAAGLTWWVAQRSTQRALDRPVAAHTGCHELMDALSDGMLIYGSDGRITACNAAAGFLLGHPRETLVGQQGFGIGCHLEDASGAPVSEAQHPVMEAFRGKGGPLRDTFQLRSADGQRRWVRSTVVPVALEPGSRAVVARLRDITDQQLDRQARREAEETFQNLFSRSPNAVSLTRPADGLVIDVNDAWCRLFEWSREEAIGRTLLDLGIWLRPEDRTLIVESFERAPDLQALPFTTQRKDGTRLHLSLALANIQVRGEVCLMAVLQDHTQAREEEAVQHRLEKAESLGQMAAGISHDFNNLFQSLLASLELAHAQSDGPARRLLDRAMVSLEQATDLSQRLMEFSGGSFTRMEPLSLSQVMQELAEHPRFQGHLGFQMNLSPGVSEVMGDGNQIRRVLGILLENAAEACEAKAGTVTLSACPLDGVGHEERRQPRWVIPAPEGPVVLVSVRDTGGGVDSDVLAHMFEPFFSTKALGRGLGLPAVLGLVRGNQGGLRVVNQPGEGLTVQVYLPIRRA